MGSSLFPPIPVPTAKAAQAVYGRSNFYLTIGDRADELFAGLDLDRTASALRKPIGLLAVLYLITLFQYQEALPDAMVADALRKRLEWKYALHMPLENYPVESTLLCQFRKGLLLHPEGLGNLQILSDRVLGDNPSGEQIDMFNPTQVITRVCRISRLAKIWQAFRGALEALAILHPNWLLAHSLPHWYERYSPNREFNYAENNLPELVAFTNATGTDGRHLLEIIQHSDNDLLSGLPEIVILQRVWNEQFGYQEGQVVWREHCCSGCSLSGRRS